MSWFIKGTLMWAAITTMAIMLALTFSALSFNSLIGSSALMLAALAFARAS